MVLYSIVGSQGTGKTVLLNELKKLGYSVVERKTSRSVLTDWNVTIQEVNSSVELTKSFQEELLARKRDDELDYITSNDIVFTERTYADLFTYTLFALGKYNDVTPWMNEYYTKCKASMQYEHIFYIPPGKFKIKDDGVRMTNPYYASAIDRTLYQITLDMINKKVDNKITVIEPCALKERVHIITSTIKNKQYLENIPE